MGLPCAHKIEERIMELPDRSGFLRLEDIHGHWRFHPPEYTRDEGPINVDADEEELLNIDVEALHDSDEEGLLNIDAEAFHDVDIEELLNINLEVPINIDVEAPMNIDVEEPMNIEGPNIEVEEPPPEISHQARYREQQQDEHAGKFVSNVHTHRVLPDRKARKPRGWVSKL
ncbi:MAG: hypothetical protein Q9214_001792 [Letrouitia sp. 1 TL-2023]